MLPTGWDIINLPCFCRFFSQNNVLINIHEYTYELICTFEHQIKGQCLRYKLVPTLSLYVKHRLSYDQFTMNTLIIQNRIMDCHGNGVGSHNPNSFFFFWTKNLAFCWSLWTIWCPQKIVLGAGCKVGLISRSPNINIVLFHLNSEFLSHNSFEWCHKVLFSSRYI